MTEKGMEKKDLLPAHRSRRRGSRAGVAARTQPKPNRTESLFFKTKICAFWLEGRCLRGAGCKYAHGDNERHEEPDLTKTALCRKMLSGGECKDPTCTYAHNRDELRSTADVYKTSMCTFFKYGRCQMGSSCRHAHFESELRSHKEIQALDVCKPINSEELEDDSDDDFLNEVDTKWERAITMPPAIGQQLPQQSRERAFTKGITPDPHPKWADITEDAEEDDDDFFDDSLWGRMSTTPAPTTQPMKEQVQLHSHLTNTMHRNGPGILEANLARPDVIPGPSIVQVQMMPQNNAMHQNGPGMMEQGAGPSNMQMPMQPQLVAVAHGAQSPCQPNMPGQGMAGPVAQNNFVQGVPAQQMQMMGGYNVANVANVANMANVANVGNVANVANVPAMAIVVPVPVPVMVMPQQAQQAMGSDGPGSPVASISVGNNVGVAQMHGLQPMPLQQMQQTGTPGIAMPGHCGAQAREVNGAAPNTVTETKKDNMMRW